MLLKSKIDGKRFIWIKVPRTASLFYTMNFFPETVFDENFLHSHYRYVDVLHSVGNYSGLAIVRNPLTRFISSLKYIALRSSTPTTHSDNYKTNIPFESMDILCNFIEQNFGRDCKISKPYETIFEKHEASFPKAFFRTQSYFVYHPSVKIFRYENLEVFNGWLETEMGIVVNQNVVKNETTQDLLSHLDFNDERFVRIVENLFYMDYKVFNYPLKYLK